MIFFNERLISGRHTNGAKEGSWLTKPTTPEQAQDEPAEGATSPAEQIAALAAAVDELRDKFLRAVAETDNVRKRAEREVAEARTYGIANFARDVIGVADNLSRALEAIPPTRARTPMRR